MRVCEGVAYVLGGSSYWGVDGFGTSENLSPNSRMQRQHMQRPPGLSDGSGQRVPIRFSGRGRRVLGRPGREGRGRGAGRGREADEGLCRSRRR